MGNRFSLSDFNPKSLDFTQDLQVGLLRYEEYLVLKNANGQGHVDETNYYRHQLVIHRLMFDPGFKAELVIHKPGTGKTQSFVGAAEMFKRYHQIYANDRINRLPIHRALILVSGKAQRNDIKRMIACGNPQEYGAQDYKGTSRRIHIGNLIKKWYEIVTYRRFAGNIIREAQKLDMSVRDYIHKHKSGIIIFVDEAQNLRLSVEDLLDVLDKNGDYSEVDSWRQSEPQSDSDTDSDSEDEPEPRRRVVKPRADVATKRLVVQLILDLIDAPYNRVMIGSATPGVNSPDDIKTPMVMAVSPHQRRPFVELDLTTVTSDELHPYIMNRVSYVESSLSNWVKDYQGEDIERTFVYPNGDEVDISLKLVIVGMKPVQEKLYRIFDTGTADEDVRRQLEINQPVTDTVFIKAKQASLFVFPYTSKSLRDPSYIEGLIGNKAFKNRNFIVEEDGQYRFGPALERLFNPTDKRGRRDNELALENLKSHSCLFYKVIEILNDPYFYVGKERLGTIGIFVEYVKSGIILLGLIIEAFTGSQLFNEGGDIISQDKRSDYCLTGNTRIKLTKAKRYAVLHTTVGLNVVDNAKSILKSEHNFDGGFIGIVLISKEATEGVSINNALGYILCGPTNWDPASSLQAESRFFRENSSDFLRNYIREAGDNTLRAKYLTNNDALKIRVYQLAACPVIQEDGKKIADINGSIQVAIYTASTAKDQLISPIMRMFKESAVDYYINQDRNMLPPEYNMTKTCDYGPCEYTAYLPLPDDLGPTIMNNYDIMYYQDHSGPLRKIIYDILTSVQEISVTELISTVIKISRLGEQSIIPVLQTLDQIISNNEQFFNDFGYARFVTISGDRVFLSDGISGSTYYGSNISGYSLGVSRTYTEQLNGVRSTRITPYRKLESRYADYQFTDDDPLMEAVRNQFNSDTNRSLVLEAALDARFTPDYNFDVIVESLLYINRNHWTECPYPQGAIAYLDKKATAPRARGRPPKGVISRNVSLKGVNLFENSTSDILIHDLSSEKASNTASLTPFITNTGPFSFKIIGESSWQTVSAVDVDKQLIVFKAIQGAFYEQVTSRLLNDRYALIKDGRPHSFYKIIYRGDVKFFYADPDRKGSSATEKVSSDLIKKNNGYAKAILDVLSPNFEDGLTLKELRSDPEYYKGLVSGYLTEQGLVLYL
jgi:hypothetical protein